MSREKQIDIITKIIARKSADYRNPKVAFMTTAKKSATAIYHEFCKMQSELTPCDLCKFNPPTSGDGKPCFMCPAQAKMEEGEE